MALGQDGEGKATADVGELVADLQSNAVRGAAVSVWWSATASDARTAVSEIQI